MAMLNNQMVSLSINLYIYIYIYLPIYRSIVTLLWMDLSIYQFTDVSIYPFIHPSIKAI